VFRRSFLRKLVAALLVVAFPAFPQQQSRQQPQQNQQPTFFSETIEVRIINVDVVVTDKSGHPVTGLQQDDFELFENGKPQTISNFLEMTPADSPEPPPPGTPKPAEANAPRPPDTRARNVVVFLDTTTIHPFTRDRIFKPLEKFLRRAMRSGDHVMIVSWNPGLKVDLPFTNDVNDAAKTLDKLIGTTTQALMSRRDLDMTKTRIHDLPADYRLMNEIPPISEAIREADSYANKVSYEQAQRVEALKSVMASLRGIGGRTALVLFTDQLSLNPAMPVYDYIYGVKDQFAGGQSYEPTMAASRFNEPDLAARVADVANSSGITVYPVSASGLGIDLDSMSAEHSGDASSIAPAMVRTDSALMTMHEIASRTGGMALTHSNNFELAFNTLTQDMISYYSLGYHTEGARKDAVRDIAVKLKKKGYTVRSRSSFIERSLTSEMQDAVAANLLYPIAKNDLNVSMAAGGPAAPSTDHVVVPVVIKIPTTNLTLIPDGTDLVGQFSSYTAFMRRDGKVSTVKRTQHQLRFPADSLKRRKEITVKYDLTIDDKTEGVSVGIMDDTSHATGFATMPITKS